MVMCVHTHILTRAPPRERAIDLVGRAASSGGCVKDEKVGGCNGLRDQYHAVRKLGRGHQYCIVVLVGLSLVGGPTRILATALAGSFPPSWHPSYHTVYSLVVNMEWDEVVV
jgi:hypothetical protein